MKWCSSSCSDTRPTPAPQSSATSCRCPASAAAREAPKACRGRRAGAGGRVVQSSHIPTCLAFTHSVHLMAQSSAAGRRRSAVRSVAGRQAGGRAGGQASPFGGRRGCRARLGRSGGHTPPAPHCRWHPAYPNNLQPWCTTAAAGAAGAVGGAGVCRLVVSGEAGKRPPARVPRCRRRHSALPSAAAAAGAPPAAAPGAPTWGTSSPPFLVACQSSSGVSNTCAAESAELKCETVVRF